jgi:hypothetical protein
MSNFLNVGRKSVASRKDRGWNYAVTNGFLGSWFPVIFPNALIKGGQQPVPWIKRSGAGI